MSNHLLKNNGYGTLHRQGFILPAGVKLSANTSKSTYEGARTGRRLSNWGSSTSGPNASSLGSLSFLRSRSRETIRNNPFGASAQEHYVSNLVGTGIKPRWKIDDVSLKESLQELWEDWVDEADAYGQTDFYGLEELIGRTQFESGEALARFRIRKLSDGMAVPLQIQVIEPDHLDLNDNRVLSNRNVVQAGIEFNGIGKKVAYHLTRNHPGDHALTSDYSRMDKIRVDADEVMHIYRMRRPGQLRGIPELSAILVRLYELDQYDDAELVRKKTAAMFSAFITKTPDDIPLDGTGGDLGNYIEDDDNNNPVVGLEPGILQYLEEGEDITFSEPADVGGNYEVWIKHQLRSIAAGIGVTYEQLTGDLSDVNYSSIRAGLLEFRRRIEMYQWNMMVFQFCRCVMKRWVNVAVTSGAIVISDYISHPRKYSRVKWSPPGWEWVDPIKDQMGDKMSIRNGFDSRENIAAKRGYDVEEIDKQNKEDNERAAKNGLVYDSNPAKTTNTGVIQDDEVVKSVINE